MHETWEKKKRDELIGISVWVDLDHVKKALEKRKRHVDRK